MSRTACGDLPFCMINIPCPNPELPTSEHNNLNPQLLQIPLTYDLVVICVF
jgi:hypothetical protein